MKNNLTYTKTAIFLHWIMAFSFIGMLISGVFMANFMEGDPLRWTLYGWHKASGILLLLTATFRLIWRLIHKPPALPTCIPKLDQLASHLGHWTLYGLMFGIPLTGWIMSSAGGHPISMFRFFDWPEFPGVLGDKAIGGFSHSAHWMLGYAAIAVVSVHILALVKHKIFEGTSLLYRMGIGKKN
ncbi:cytochrome b [Alphaproteobacteria bacterium]|nr:cytochrome b [Alphaproteobacteria bacterium]